MGLADELAKLEELRRSGALSEFEFAAAKKALLTAPAAPAVGDQLSAHLEEVRFQNELAQLDREWELEREQYMIVGRYGVRYVPTTGGGAFGWLLLVPFAVVWTVMASIMAVGGSRFLADHPMAGPGEAMIPWLFPCFGVLFIIAAVVMCMNANAKAREYEQAHAAYQRRRSELLARRGG